IEILSRAIFKIGVPGSGPFVQHLTLLVGFLGAAIAAREGRLLNLAVGGIIPIGLRPAAEILAAAISTMIATLLCVAGIGMVLVERQAGGITAATVPVWVGELVLPL